MSQLPNKFLFLSKTLLSNAPVRRIAAVVISLQSLLPCQSQIINYISNGSFEEVLTNTSTPLFYSAKFWGGIDSSKYYGEVLSKITPPVKVPLSSYTYQEPRHGNNHIITTLYSNGQNNNRGYPRNRLKTTLKSGKAYCYTMYVNLSNNSVTGVDRIGVYFGDSSVDTISQCNKPITYLTPQVQNPTNNIITDTLNWVLVQGQFTANGTEKYALIGNFKTDANTNTVLANPTHSPAIASEYLLDYISLIEIDLPAFAGRDTVVFAGDSVFLGREPDVGIDEACIWYKLPETTPIDTIAGFWLKPTETCTYVVRQEICGLVKWDTVRVYMDAVGIEKLKILNDEVKIYPVPAENFLNIESNAVTVAELFKLNIINNLGEIVHEEELTFENQRTKIKVKDLQSGVYFLQLQSKDGIVRKRFVITR